MKRRAIILVVAAALAPCLSTLAAAETVPISNVTFTRAGAAEDVAVEFVTAANQGDYRTVCRLYSVRYLKASQAVCRSLYSWGARLYGRYDYRIVGRRTLADGRRRVDLIRWQHPSFIELKREQTGWRIVAGGW
jgi:hypothetical protein